jgi:hypothetical protein
MDMRTSKFSEEQIIGFLRHSLAVLASCMPWQDIEASLAHRFARQTKATSG